jgi:hypothetical protein
MYSFSDRDVDLLREYREVPSRKRSLDLQRLLTRLRSEGIENKLAILTLQMGKEWAIGQLGATRGAPIRIYDERRFVNYKDAEWALLKLRWVKHSGLPWPKELV